MVGAGGIVFAAAFGVGEGVVGIVYLLEFAGAFSTFRVISGNTIGVGFEGGAGKSVNMSDRCWWCTENDVGLEGLLPFVGIANLLLGRGRGDFQDGICERVNSRPRAGMG